jgi:ketosteroid isomerase-like protein
MASAQPALSEIRLAMAATNEIFNVEIFGKRNFAALDNVYTSDARILPPGAPMVSGREAIKKFWSDLVTGADAKSAVLSSIDVMLAGDGVVEIGSAALTLGGGGQLEVKYVVYWRQEDSLWKWHVDIWNPNA